MADVLAFKRKDNDTGVDLETISGDDGIHVYFPGQDNKPEYTIAIAAKVSTLNDTIKSETHQLAVWHALCQLDSMRKNAYAGTEGVAGWFGVDTQVQLQLGLIPSKK